MPQHRSLLPIFSTLLTCHLVLFAPSAMSATVLDATDAQLKTATEQYGNGVAAMDAEKYAEALEHFRKSYETVASPNSRMMIGRALVKLGKVSEAYVEFSQAVKQSAELALVQKKYKKTQESAQKEIDEIKGQLAYVIVRQGAVVELQGRVLVPSGDPMPEPVLPGDVVVNVTFPDGQKRTSQINLKPGETKDFVVLPPLPQVAPPAAVEKPKPSDAELYRHRSANGISRRTLGFVFGTVGLVGVGTFVGFGIIGAGHYGNSRADCSLRTCPKSAIDNEHSKSLMQGIGYAGLGIGVLGLGAGTVLFLMGDPKPKSSTALSVGPSEIALRHQF